MGFSAGSVKSVAKILVYLAFVAGILLVIIPILYGVGDKSATALEVNGTDIVGNYTAMNESVAETGNDLFTFLPWLGVGLVVAAGFGLMSD